MVLENTFYNTLFSYVKTFKMSNKQSENIPISSSRDKTLTTGHSNTVKYMFMNEPFMVSSAIPVYLATLPFML